MNILSVTWWIYIELSLLIYNGLSLQLIIINFPGAAAASRVYVDALSRLARQAQLGTWGGSKDVGEWKTWNRSALASRRARTITHTVCFAKPGKEKWTGKQWWTRLYLHRTFTRFMSLALFDVCALTFRGVHEPTLIELLLMAPSALKIIFSPLRPPRRSHFSPCIPNIFPEISPPLWYIFFYVLFIYVFYNLPVLEKYSRISLGKYPGAYGYVS